MDFLSEEDKKELKELYDNIPKEWKDSNLVEKINVNTTLGGFGLVDWDQVEYKNDLLNHLLVEYHNFSTHAMSDHQLYLQGQKNMLGALILIIKRS